MWEGITCTEPNPFWECVKGTREEKKNVNWSRIRSHEVEIKFQGTGTQKGDNWSSE